MTSLPRTKRQFDKLGTQIYELPDMSQVLICSKGPEGYAASLRNQKITGSTLKYGFSFIEGSKEVESNIFLHYAKMKRYAEAILDDFNRP
jgi:hypothetical protein